MAIMSAIPFVAVLLIAPPADAPPTGEALFKTYCASCHGAAGKGDGVMAPHLRARPADLTLVAKRRAGRFDADEVGKMVDGRRPVPSHGGREMPVWGDVFKLPSDRDREKAAQARIRALVDYLKTIQVK